MRKLLMGGPQLLAFDSFTDVNGTALTAHTADTGQSWTHGAGTGTATIQNNKAQFTGVTSEADPWVIPAGVANVTVSATMNWAANEDAGLVVRWLDANNYWFFDGAQSTGVWTVFEKTAGVQTSRASGTFAFSLNTDYQVRVVASGPLMSLFVNGALVVSFNSANQQGNTKHGIFIGGAAAVNVLVDNFRVTTP